MNSYISEYEKSVLILFAAFVVSVEIAFTITYSDATVAFSGLMALIAMGILFKFNYSKSSSPMVQFINPIEESLLILVIYLDMVWFVFQLISNATFIILSILIFISVSLMVIILRYGCGYPLSSMGFVGKICERNEIAIISLISLTIGFIIRIIPLLDDINKIFEPEILANAISMVFFYGLVVGFSEELVFRGIIQPRLSLVFNSKIIGLIAASSLFAVLHILNTDQYLGVYYDPIGSLFAALLTRLAQAILLGIVWISSEKIIFPTMVHALSNSFFIIILILEAI